MDSYASLFWMMVFVVVGYVFGAVLTIYLLRGNPIQKISSSQRKYHVENEAVTKALVSEIEEDSECDEMHDEEKNSDNLSSKGSLLKQRLGKKRDSWTEFNCVCDSVDEAEYIKSSRKSEENSYQYTKRKNKDL